MKPSARFFTVVPIVVVPALLFLAAPVGWHPIHVMGLFLLIASTILLVLARMQLGNAFSLTPQATFLVTHGLYSRIRNPVYVFSTLLLAGLILYLNRPLAPGCLNPFAHPAGLQGRARSACSRKAFW
jgi:protein-S-isoprenylcysteine O-methyltransferase Ste14